MYTVYMHINKINDKKYIGITCLKPEHRWGRNGSGYKECPIFSSAINKYGWNNFEHVILFDDLTKEEAASKEIELIRQYNTRDSKFGYNVSVGGYSQPGAENPFYGHHHTEAVKEKVRESNRRRVWTDEAKASIREKLSGGNSPCSKRIYCNELKMEFSSLTEASEYTGASKSKISQVAKGQRKHTKGYTFYYIDAV